ncbi:MAG: ABC transporter ATP-binding protein [Bacteroidetes bacterium]|nr:ABC transporter ATP-binding protein [Bacteroidota bacterium]
MIYLQGISKIYTLGQVKVKALQSISLTIDKGEYVAIMGPSGSGKSTLMNIIGCLDTPTDGIYKLNNILVSEQNDDQLALIRNKEIGFVFQMFNLLPRLTALENVALPLIYASVNKEEREKKALDSLDVVGLGDRVNHKPNELSGGEQQRVAVARSMVNNPSIILADEPTGNLDSKVSEDIMVLLDKIHQEGNTVILVTHENEIAKHAHRIIKLRDGLVESDEVNQNPFTSIGSESEIKFAISPAPSGDVHDVKPLKEEKEAPKPK